MARSLEHYLEGKGPIRSQELSEAYANYTAAKNVLADLEAELAQVNRELATTGQRTTVMAGIATSTLAVAMSERSALDARMGHLKDTAIPQAQGQVQRTSLVYSRLVSTHQKQDATEAEQQAIIAAAQAKLERLWAWRAA